MLSEHLLRVKFGNTEKRMWPLLGRNMHAVLWESNQNYEATDLSEGWFFLEKDCEIIFLALFLHFNTRESWYL